MDTGVCWHCIEDKYLREIIRDQGKPLECSVCNATRNGFTVDELGEQLEPIIRENYQLGEDVRVFSVNDDKDGWEQEGDPLSDVVQEILGQYFEFNDEIVEAVVSAEDVDVRDGDVLFLTAPVVTWNIRSFHTAITESGKRFCKS